MRGQSDVIYTWTDEAPMLATHSLLPIIEGFTRAADVSLSTADISLAGRRLAAFGLAEDDLAALGALTSSPRATIIKLPNISASLPQLKAAIAELRARGHELPDYPDSPSSDAEREAALAALLPLQKGDFIQMFETMNGKPMTVRLIDPPLHEFLPDLTELSVKVALDRERGELDPADEELLAVVRKNHESNPMLGLRGVRLLLTMPGLIELQVRAIAEAAVERLKAGGDPHPEIMIPLIGSVRELQLARERVEHVLQEVSQASGYALDFPVGCMIELPRAAVTAAHVAEEADFFSFGTNDLTQTTWGFSRDDVAGSFVGRYIDDGIFGVSTFETIDADGVGGMVRLGVEGGRSTKPTMKMGVCGEHGGDPESIGFFHRVGLNYVSCSPFRVPVARLEAGRAAVADKAE